MRQGVARKTQVHSSKIKVTLMGQKPKLVSTIRVQPVTSSSKMEFRNSLTQAIITTRQRVAF